MQRFYHLLSRLQIIDKNTLGMIKSCTWGNILIKQNRNEDSFFIS